jgi:hypothetical protein
MHGESQLSRRDVPEVGRQLVALKDEIEEIEPILQKGALGFDRVKPGAERLSAIGHNPPLVDQDNITDYVTACRPVSQRAGRRRNSASKSTKTPGFVDARTRRSIILE